MCPPGKKDRLVTDDDQQGLAVRVGAGAKKAGSLKYKSFLVQYNHGGKKGRLSLGACSAIALAAARKAAQGIMGDVAHGRNPAQERKEKARKAARDAYTFGAVVDDFEELHLRTRRPSYAEEAARTIRRVFKKQLPWPASSIDRKTIVRVLDELARAGAPIMAARAAGYASAAFGWAVKRGALETNPFAKLPVAATTKRDRVLSDQELRAIWRATEDPGSFNAIVRVLILTGQRREEVAGMMRDELSDDLSTWTLPAARAKNNVAHIVPLSAQAHATIAAQPRSHATSLVFPGIRGDNVFNGWGRAKATLDRASGVTGWTLHDLRRTCATGLQRLGIRLEVTEAVLNHTGGSRSGIVGIYQRHDWADEKRAALQAWGVAVEAIAKGRGEASNVIPLTATGAQ